MNIVLTGSISNVGKPLTQQLVRNGHSVSVITSKAERVKEIESLGATAVVGSMFDVPFLAATFQGADIVYLMETLDAAGDFFDKEADFLGAIRQIGKNYSQAVLQSGVTRVVHLSSVGAHMKSGNGILQFHYNVEAILKQLPAQVSIKFMRPVGFYSNLFGLISNIKTKGAIVSNYGGDKKEPWVSPADVAAAIAEEMDKPFAGRTIRYVASEELSPNEIATALGHAIGKPELPWQVVSDEQLLSSWLTIGFNAQIAHGFVEMQASQGSGLLYQDYYRHKPTLGKEKLHDFVKQFAAAYHVD
ncbi:SDR family oxidoreductase [Chryseolinea lacunae]|uniref:NmrA family NAD(P)-binding protein n=1 Tax=Chryseolinea lacunae TaxID=2801331 RepID=A0ABS1L297_9BACT|nr:NAD(P)H-binding protein [Chryseolinea lacunae]MBL0745811.1 NmrA family NAD(P)-binding protein [Chryseolinea lacunae]